MNINSRHKKLGFKQALNKEWLDYAVMLLLQKAPDTRQKIFDFIKKTDTANGARTEGSVKQTMNVLGAWISPDQDLVLFREQQLNEANNLDKSAWNSLHWAALCASYPFFFCVTNVIGRLLSLQNAITKSQILSRLSEIYGEREVVERNMRYVIQTLMNLNLLKKTEDRGVYAVPEPLTILGDSIVLLLWKALLHANEDGRMPILSQRNAPAFYAFTMPEIDINDNLLHKFKMERLLLGSGNEYLSIAEKK